MNGPSPRELQTLRFIEWYAAKYGDAPRQSEIAAHLKANSRGFVCRMLTNMERKGLIARQWCAPKSIRVAA